MKLPGVDSAIIVESGNVQMGDALMEQLHGRWHFRTALLRCVSRYRGGVHDNAVHLP
jgi:hypothetical protein